MKNINKTFNAIFLWTMLIFSIGIAGTYLSDYLISINWFGDADVYQFNWRSGNKERYTEWGARHYWYNWSVSISFVISIVRGIFSVNSISEK